MASSTSNNPIKSCISLLSQFFDSRFLFLKYQRKFNSIFFHREFYRILYIQAVTAFRHIPILTAHLLLFTPLFITLTFPHPLLADIVTDGSVGPSQALSGPDMTIPESIGAVSGQNLFHSFQTFNIAENQSATFTGSDAISNVISRVTGGDISTIDGKLISKVGNADFFFINPSGVVFGPHASVDVPAAFHVSTADALHFSDGTVLSCTSPDPSILTQAAPEAFGFLGTQRASIEINGSVLAFEPESSVSITAGDIAIYTSNDSPYAAVLNEDGNLQITATGNTPSQIPLKQVGFGNDKASHFAVSKNLNGELSIDTSIIDVSGTGKGTLEISGGNMNISDAYLASNSYYEPITSDPTIVGHISISASESVQLENGTFISTDTYSQQNGGDIIVKSKNMKIDGKGLSTGLSSENKFLSPADTGNIHVEVNDSLEITDGGMVSTSTQSEGNAGDIDLSAKTILIDGKGFAAGIYTSNEENSQGNSGKVTITASDNLTILNNGKISSHTFGQGEGGGISIHAGDLFIKDGLLDEPTNIRTGIFSETYLSDGTAGDIELTVKGVLDISDGGQISTSSGQVSTNSKGNAGNITISANNIRIDDMGNEDQLTGIWSQAFSEGNAGDIVISADELLELHNGAWISTQTSSKGEGGTININAKNLTIDNQNLEYQLTGIWSDTETDDYSISEQGGDAGSITLHVSEFLKLDNGGRISSASVDSEGNAGTVSIYAPSIRLNNGANILTNSLCNYSGKCGNAGTIYIKTDNMIIDGEGNYSHISSSSNGSGGVSNAGDIELFVKELLEIKNFATISTWTSSIGDAGQITISADEIKIDGQGNPTGIISNTFDDSQGDAGTINIFVSESMEIVDSGWISSITDSDGNGGNILIEAENVKIGGKGKLAIISSSSTNTDKQGNAGAIELVGLKSLTILNQGEISSSTVSYGNAGNINIVAEKIIIDGQGYDKTTAIIDSASLLNESEANAGDITINASDLLHIKSGGTISTDTVSKGDAGNIIINSKNIIIDNQNLEKSVTSISSSTALDDKNNIALGNAGTIIISASGNIDLRNNGIISTDSTSIGNAGNIIINAKSINIDGNGKPTGIFSNAFVDKDFNENSEAISGKIEISATGQIHMQNNALITNVTQSFGNTTGNITISASKITLKNGSKITSQSAGQATASDIKINVEMLTVTNSDINTSALYADGGDIIIQNNNLFLCDGLITTSVKDTNGDGGDIKIQGTTDDDPADHLVMKHGFIQANTAAKDAKGGDILLDVNGIIFDKSGEGLSIDSPDRKDFDKNPRLSVIQAAAPEGTRGEIHLNEDSLLDISGSIADISTRITEPLPIFTDPCRMVENVNASAILQEIKADPLIWAEAPSTIPFTTERLKTIEIMQ